MDGQNMNNKQNNYQDNTAATPVAPVVEAAPEKKTDALAIVALVAGILSIVLACCTTYFGAIPAIAGIICAIISKKKNGKSGMATAGLICSIVGIVIVVLWIVFVVVLGVGVGMAALSDPSLYY